MPFMSKYIRLLDDISFMDIIVQTVFYFKKWIKINLERKAGRVKKVLIFRKFSQKERTSP